MPSRVVMSVVPSSGLYMGGKVKTEVDVGTKNY